MTNSLAVHYAGALADAVFAPGSGLAPEQAARKFHDAEAAISASSDLQTALASPAVTKSRKMAIMSDLAKQMGLHRLLTNFLLVVTRHRRMAELAHIRTEFERIVDERLGWIPAEIASARDLTAEQRGEIERSLADRLHKRIRASYRSDPALLGGVRVRVASREYDATLRGRLESMRRRLVGSL
ncbi:MAG: ATP synthase F1 subunit delta [Bryobacteraceae bacterium]